MTQMGHFHYVMNFVRRKTPLICSVFPLEEFQAIATIPAISCCPVFVFQTQGNITFLSTAFVILAGIVIDVLM